MTQFFQLKFNQEVLCELVGSGNILIDGPKLVSLPKITPTQLFQYYDELISPNKETGNYIITVDTSRGADLDYSAFVVFDISVMPYQIVAKYAFNGISTLMYPEVIHKVALRYNEAFVLIETNDLGQQVADILFYDLEYENVYMSVSDKIKEGGGDKRKRPGLRTTKRTKAIGCDQLKILVESDHLSLNDADIISELMTFVRVGTSYKAESGKHDDLAMCCILFAYLTQEPVFKELFDFSLRKEFIKKQILEFDEQLDPIGFLDNGIEQIEEPTVFAGDLWMDVAPGTRW